MNGIVAALADMFGPTINRFVKRIAGKIIVGSFSLAGKLTGKIIRFFKKS